MKEGAMIVVGQDNVIRRIGFKYLAKFPPGTEILSSVSTERGIVYATNKGGYLLVKRTGKLRKLKLINNKREDV